MVYVIIAQSLNGGQVVVGGLKGLYSKNTIALLIMVACSGTTGIIVSGGREPGGSRTPSTSVELLYGNGSSCWLPDLPEGRWSHSQSGLVICGGGYKKTLRSCSTLVAGVWTPSHTLQQQRSSHLSWETEGGIILLGGRDRGARQTTELLSSASSTTTLSHSQSHFALPYDTR